MKKLKQTYLRSGRVIGAVLLLLMIVGSIWDLPISKFLYPGRESSFGQFFAAFGELPAFLAMTSAGVLLFFNRKRLRKSWNVLFLAAAAVLVAGGIVLSIHEATDNVPAMPLWVAALVTVFAAALAGFLLLLGTEGCRRRRFLRFILVLAFISIGMMIVINVIKIPWGRPRMRLLLSTGNESYFQPWWKLGGSLKAKLIAEGVASDEFRSFPVGAHGLRGLRDAGHPAADRLQAAARQGAALPDHRRGVDSSGRLLAADDGRALPDRRDRRDGHHARHCVARHLALLF